MRRFRSRLERVQRLRAHEERQWRSRLACAAGACAEIEAVLSDLTAQAQTAAHQRAHAERPHATSEVYQADLYESWIHQRQSALNDRLIVAIQERSAVEAEYQRARRDLRVIEKLGERRRHDHQQGERRREQASADEVGATQFIRRNRQAH